MEDYRTMLEQCAATMGAVPKNLHNGRIMEGLIASLLSRLRNQHTTFDAFFWYFCDVANELKRSHRLTESYGIVQEIDRDLQEAGVTLPTPPMERGDKVWNERNIRDFLCLELLLRLDRREEHGISLLMKLNSLPPFDFKTGETLIVECDKSCHGGILSTYNQLILHNIISEEETDKKTWRALFGMFDTRKDETYCFRPIVWHSAPTVLVDTIRSLVLFKQDQPDEPTGDEPKHTWYNVSLWFVTSDNRPILPQTLSKAAFKARERIHDKAKERRRATTVDDR